MEEAADSQTEPFDTPVQFRGSTSVAFIVKNILQRLSCCGRV